MMQGLLNLLARVWIGIIGVGPVMLELKRAIAVKDARDSIVVAIGTMAELDGDDDGGGGIEARGIGFGEYMMPGCDCEVDDDE